MTAQEVLAMVRSVRSVYLASALKSYMVDISEASRRHSAIELGLSPRATLAARRRGASPRSRPGARLRHTRRCQGCRRFGARPPPSLRAGSNARMSAEDSILELLADVPVPVVRWHRMSRSKDFDALHEKIERAIGPIRKIGDLAIYDIAHRIGAYLEKSPRLVYLHRGTAVGARHLGFRGATLEPKPTAGLLEICWTQRVVVKGLFSAPRKLMSAGVPSRLSVTNRKSVGGLPGTTALKRSEKTSSTIVRVVQDAWPRRILIWSTRRPALPSIWASPPCSGSTTILTPSVSFPAEHHRRQRSDPHAGSPAIGRELPRSSTARRSLICFVSAAPSCASTKKDALADSDLCDTPR